jgi:hypothetical protein
MAKAEMSEVTDQPGLSFRNSFHQTPAFGRRITELTVEPTGSQMYIDGQ